MKLFKFFALSLILSNSANAYISITESGELIPRGHYQVGLEPQLLTNHGGGINMNVFLDNGISDAMSARIELGGGAVDFNAFASVKWIPIPDFENQPAMGLRIGGGLARDESENLLHAQVAPMVSKKYGTSLGLANPYLAVPFTIVNTQGQSTVGTNLTIGSEFHYEKWHAATLGAEWSLDLNKSYSYISAFVAFPFESHKGFGR